jgi:hypothetical protein
MGNLASREVPSQLVAAVYFPIYNILMQWITCSNSLMSSPYNSHSRKMRCVVASWRQTDRQVDSHWLSIWCRVIIRESVIKSTKFSGGVSIR